MRLVRSLTLFCTLGAAAAVAHAATPNGPVAPRYDFKVGAHPLIAVDSDGGSVSIAAGPAGVVQVEVESPDLANGKLDATQVEVRLEGDTVHVRYHANHHWGSNRGVGFRISAPAASRVEGRTGGGSVELRGLGGGIDLQTGGGSIEADALRGHVRIHTGGGSIRARALDGTIDLQSGGGAIHVDAAALHGKNRVETGGGSIHVAIPDGSQLDVDASTGAGSAHNDFGLPEEGHVSRSFHGRIGNGSGGSLDLHTGAGSVALTRR